MRFHNRCAWFLIAGCAVTEAQTRQENRTLVVNGQAGEGTVILMNGRSYVDLETLARIGHGSVGFHGQQVNLVLPGAAPSTPPMTASNGSSDDGSSEAEQRSPVGLSRKFMISAIETISRMREWGTALAYTVQNGLGINEEANTQYRQQAEQSLMVAGTDATTQDDRNALQLLTNELEAVKQWSNKLVEAKRSMDMAKYSASFNTLRDDPLSQKIIACGHFLVSMLGSAAFKDDATCH